MADRNIGTNTERNTGAGTGAVGRNPRDYGFGDSTQFVRGVPRVDHRLDDGMKCPLCGCESLYAIKVDVEHPNLRGGKGVGTYIGCPACPWASPMAMVSNESRG